LEDLANRYKEIHGQEQKEANFVIAPQLASFIERLVWPLRHAKIAYVLGNCLGTIALSGFVAEMVALLVFDISELSLNDQEFDEEVQKGLFGSSFEKLGQTHRVRVLRTLGLINENQEKDFRGLMEIRRKYLHHFTQEHTHIDKDARNSYVLAFKLIVSVTGGGFGEDGSFALTPKFEAYLRKIGVIRD
jgi:hypothetical protein